MKRLLLLLSVFAIASSAAAEDVPPGSEVLAHQLKTAKPKERIVLLKTIANWRDRGTCAVPVLREFLESTKKYEKTRCGTGIARKFAVVALASIEQGDEGIRAFVRSAKESRVKTPAQQFAEELLAEADNTAANEKRTPAAKLSSEARSLASKLQLDRAWKDRVSTLKPIVVSRQKAAWAAPVLREYIEETKGSHCGPGIAHYFAVMALASVENGDKGLQSYIKSAKTTGSTNPARVFAVKLIDEKGFVSLFDEKTLNGWEGKEGVFRIQDKSIIAGNLKTKIPNNEFLCTEKTYSNFELRLQAKLTGEGKNAGIQFRSKRIPDHHEVIGYQADIGVSGKDHSIWGALYDESRRRKFLAEGDQEKLRKAVKSSGWNDFVIRCEGSRIQIWVNKVQTVDYTEKDKDIVASGIIGLQIHSGPPAEASYRNIRIRELQ